MRVLFVTTGGWSRVENFLKELVERGHETYHVYLRPSGAEFWVPGVQELCLGDDVARDEPFFAPRILKHGLSFLRFRRYLWQVRPDVLVAAHLLGPGLMAAVSGFRPRILVTLGSDALVHPNRGFPFRMVIRFASRRADHVVCNAESVRRVLEELGIPGTRIQVIPYGIDVNQFAPNGARGVRRTMDLRPEHRVMIMTRWFKPIYGIEYFLAALPDVFAAVPNGRAVLVGAGPLQERLQRQAANLGIEDHVRFPGAVPNAELPGYLNAADVYVSTSLSDGSSVALLEGMACGLPAVVTDVPSNFEWVKPERTGFIVPRRSVKPLVGPLSYLLRHKRRAIEMGRHGRRRIVEGADWRRNFQAFQILCESAMDQCAEG